MSFKSLFVNTPNILLINPTTKSVFMNNSTTIINNNTSINTGTTSNSTSGNITTNALSFEFVNLSTALNSSVITPCDNSCTNYRTLLNSNVFKTIEDLIEHYNTGDFQYLIDNLTIDNYNELSVEIYDLILKNNNDPYYEIIREYISDTLQALYQAVLNIDNIQDLTYKTNSLLEKNKILSNYKRLKEYLEHMKDSMGGIFKDFEVKVTTAKIKPEYQIYIQKYGFPPNAVFDPDLLAPILEFLYMK